MKIFFMILDLTNYMQHEKNKKKEWKFSVSRYYMWLESHQNPVCFYGRYYHISWIDYTILKKAVENRPEIQNYFED